MTMMSQLFSFFELNFPSFFQFLPGRPWQFDRKNSIGEKAPSGNSGYQRNLRNICVWPMASCSYIKSNEIGLLWVFFHRHRQRISDTVEIALRMWNDFPDFTATGFMSHIDRSGWLCRASTRRRSVEEVSEWQSRRGKCLDEWDGILEILANSKENPSGAVRYCN